MELVLPMNPRSYDAAFLRTQMVVLRQAAAERASREKAISTDYEVAVRTAHDEQQAATAAAGQEQAATIASLTQEYADTLARIEAKAAAERAKLDEQRTQFATQVARQSDAKEKKLRGDDQFEESSSREVAKEKKKKPQRLFQK